RAHPVRRQVPRAPRGLPRAVRAPPRDPARGVLRVDVGHADAPDALHDQVRAAVVGADVVDRRYARVLQPGGDARLADEPPDQLLVPLAGREADELDRHLAFQPDVPAGTYLAHQPRYSGSGSRSFVSLL